MFTFIRIPKSGSTSVMASISKISDNYEKRHLTVKEILLDGQEHKFFTMIRNPIQQSVSMYYQSKTYVDQNLDYSDTPQPMLPPFIEHMNVIRQTDGLEEYLLSAPTNAFLGKYLSGMDPLDLAVVGHVDFMEKTRALFNASMGFSVNPFWLKKNPLREKDFYGVSHATTLKFKSRNELEYSLYYKSLDVFNDAKCPIGKW